MGDQKNQGEESSYLTRSWKTWRAESLMGAFLDSLGGPLLRLSNCNSPVIATLTPSSHPVFIQTFFFFFWSFIIYLLFPEAWPTSYRNDLFTLCLDKAWEDRLIPVQLWLFILWNQSRSPAYLSLRFRFSEQKSLVDSVLCGPKFKGGHKSSFSRPSN